MRPSYLPLCRPCFGEEEFTAVREVLESGWITTGPKVKRFEEEFASFVGVGDALALNSATAALHLALASLGIGPGDAVITTPMTFCSTVHVIEHVGARPILVDVEPDTLNIDPQRIHDVIKSETRSPKSVMKAVSNSAVRNPQSAIKAVIPVHLYGHPCDMDAILGIAEKYGLALIEDAAHALPAWYKGRMIGSPPPPRTTENGQQTLEPRPETSDSRQRTTGNGQRKADVPQLTCFSFYATKNLSTGEGGC